MLRGCRRSRPPSTDRTPAPRPLRHASATPRRWSSTPRDPPPAGPAPRHPRDSLRSRAALSTYATAVQGLARLLYGVLIGHLGSRELLGQTNTSLSLSVLASQLWAAPASAAGTRFVAARGHARRTPRGRRRSSPAHRHPDAP